MADVARLDPEDPLTKPLPEGGWSERLLTLDDAVVVPPKESSFVQAAGVLHSDGRYCAEAALWRRFRPLTTEPEPPESPPELLPGRWLWGGVLWAHFGHFLVESASRLWALSFLDQPVDGILFIPKRPAVGDAVRQFQRDYVDLISPGQTIQVVTDPSRVEQLVVPGQGHGLGPIIEGTAKFRDSMHRDFAADVEPSGAEKLYISRSELGLGKGGLLGEEAFEQRLAAEGYDIFHPQRFSLREQLARYKAASHVIAVDGSALHLFATVGRAEQNVAMVLRRRAGANNFLSSHVEHFCGRPPVQINALRTEWVKASRGKSNRLSFGELDLPKAGRALADAGFLPEGTDWPAITKEQRKEMLACKGFGDGGEFIEAPHYARQRVRQLRRERRARRATPTAT